MCKYIYSVFKNNTDDYIGMTEELLKEIEGYESPNDEFSTFLGKKNIREINDITQALESCNCYEACKSIKKLSNFWIRCILLTNAFMLSDTTVKTIEEETTAFDDLVNIISQQEVLKDDKNIFPFLTRLKNNSYSADELSQILMDYASFLIAVGEAIPHC